MGEKIVVDRADDNDDETGDEGKIDQREDTDDHVGGWRLRDLDDKFIQLDEKLDHQRRQANDQSQQKGSDQPSAVEHDRFEDMTETSHLAPRHMDTGKGHYTVKSGIVPAKTSAR